MKPLLCSSLLLLTASLAAVQGSVVLSSSPTTPVTDALDQYNLINDASPGAYPYSVSAYSDRSPGQSFTTPAGGSVTLDSFSLKGAGDAGPQDGVTWTITVGTVSQAGLAITFNSIQQSTLIPTPGSLSSTDWLTWTFTGADVLTLDANTVYGIQIQSSSGYYAFAAATTSTAYPGGVAFAPSQPDWGPPLYPGLVDYGYDRTFVVGLSAVPEPACSALLLGGLVLVGRRFRMKR